MQSGDQQVQYLQFKGGDALKRFVSDITLYGDKRYEDEESLPKIQKFMELYNLLQVIDSILIKINNSSLAEEDVQYFKSSIAYQFNSKVKPQFTANEQYRLKNVEPCIKLNYMW